MSLIIKKSHSKADMDDGQRKNIRTAYDIRNNWVKTTKKI